MFDWNDLRHLLAVAETGSTLAAGRRLRVSQTTVARRVAALEDALGLALFERLQAGYAPTAACRALLAQAQAVETAATAFLDASASQLRESGGMVRLTMEEIMATAFIPAVLGPMRAAHPDILVEIDSSDTLRDLATGAADIAIRSCAKPEGAGLVGRRIAEDAWTLYCSRGYAEARDVPRTLADLKAHPIIGGGSPGVARVYDKWLGRQDLTGAVVIRQGSVSGLLAAVRAGAGIAILPALVAESEPDLVRCMSLHSPGGRRSVWLLTHERHRHEPRIRRIMDFLALELKRRARAAQGAHRGPVEV
jgi:DNA-binding transcriptional LysR family regulator